MPGRARRTNGKHRKQALNIQVAACLGGDLVAVSRPLRGSRHDSRALEEVGWAQQITTSRAGNELLAVFADSAYVKHAKLTPRPKKKNVPRTEADKEWNRKIARMRVPVERTIAHLKQWKILSTGYRWLAERATQRDPRDHQPRVLPAGPVDNAPTRTR